MNSFWNSCRSHRRSICLLAGGALAEPERLELENHLAICPGCRGYLGEIKTVTVPLAGWKNSFAPIEPRPAAQLRWAKAIRAAQPETLIAPPGWLELFRPFRHAWAGMGAVWLVMWALNWERPEASHFFSGNASARADAVRTIEEQRQILAELVPSSNPQPAEPPRRNNSSPHSERQKTWMAS